MSGLMDRWAGRFTNLPDRSTFYSWISDSTFSGNLETYFKLCACLDVDPLALLSSDMFERESFGDRMLMLIMGARPDRRTRRDGTGRGIRIDDWMGQFGPLSDWPSRGLVSKIFKRDWERRFFANVGQARSRYETIRLSFGPESRPRLVHFAYRGSPAELWRMYGSVENFGRDSRLIHFYGNNQKIISVEGVTLVETRFGEGPCEFCLASLHDFDFEMIGETSFENSLKFSS